MVQMVAKCRIFSGALCEFLSFGVDSHPQAVLVPADSGGDPRLSGD